eukprot:1026635-Amphidinium_carterae.2
MNMHATLIQSGLLETYGYHNLKDEDVARSDVPQKLPKNMWIADARAFSIGGQEGLQSLSSEDGWKSVSPPTAAGLPLLSEALLHCQKTGWTKAYNTWMSLLVPQGSVLIENDRKADKLTPSTPYGNKQM